MNETTAETQPTQPHLGFCNECFRVRWLETVKYHDKAGNPCGVCRECARNAEEAAS